MRGGFRKYSHVEPLNGETIITKIRLCVDQQQKQVSSTLLLRDVFNRLLFFDKDDVNRELEQEKPRYTAVSHTNVPGCKPASGLFQALPYASLLAPPSLPFPARETSKVWSEQGGLEAPLPLPSSFFTLEEYFDRVAAAQKFSQEAMLSGWCSANADCNQEQRHQHDLFREQCFTHSVGVLTATRNQLKFVVGDVARNCWMAPLPAMRLETMSVGAGSSAAEQVSAAAEREEAAFIKSFWKSLSEENENAKNALDKCSVLWYRLEGFLESEMFDCADDSFPLQSDPRWLKLPAKIAKGKKAKYDTDSLLRDLFIGNMSLF